MPRCRYHAELSANYGSGFFDRLAASKRTICTGGDGSDIDNGAAAYFYGEAVIDGCNGNNCFPHRYGGGMRIFEFLSAEIEGSAHRFKCPSQAQAGEYASIFSPNNLLDQQKEIILSMSPVSDLSPSCPPPLGPASSSVAPRTLTMLLSRDGHLNNFHCAGKPSCPRNICHHPLLRMSLIPLYLLRLTLKSSPQTPNPKP